MDHRRGGGDGEGNYDGNVTFLFSVPIIITLAVMLGFYLYENGLYFIEKMYRKSYNANKTIIYNNNKNDGTDSKPVQAKVASNRVLIRTNRITNYIAI